MMAAENGTTQIDPKLHSEIRNLIQYVERLRQEIAGITQQKDSRTRFEGMADRLDAIITSTAEATDIILESMEGVDGLVAKVRAGAEGEELDKLCDQISEKTTVALEACSFQDLTGQRVSKVIKSLRFVEERVDAMADLCGREQLNSVDVEFENDDEQIDDGVKLEGPQRTGEAISQADIDALFN